MRVLQRLIFELQKLPGFGPRSASRLAYFLSRRPNLAEELGRLLLDLRGQITTCSVCFNISDHNPCSICVNPSRDHSTICAVEGPEDVEAIERTKNFFGVYHVLGGALEPHRGVNPENLRIRELLERIGRGNVKELILATNPTTEGETTAMFIVKELKPHPPTGGSNRKSSMKVSRIARGIPTGAELEYADDLTLIKALEGRQGY